MTESTVFLESIAKILLFLHLVAIFVLVGSMGHSLVIIVQYCFGNFIKEAKEGLYMKMSFWAYLITFLTGSIIYPTFRVRVRAEYLDHLLPWATGLFEVKEHWAAIGMALFFGLYYLRRNFNPAAEKEKLFLYVPLYMILNVIVLYSIYTGFYLTTLKGI
ncbi:MAG: hypothetical protein H8E14_12490 [Candidatus Marinimicrobia bacterium]|nr:hypothetical protein [Candidatus Neomarinimicrobiota bacterium]